MSNTFGEEGVGARLGKAYERQVNKLGPHSVGSRKPLKVFELPE